MNQQFVIYVRNGGYAVSLEKTKPYELLPDSAALQHGQIRVIDEAGDNCLYPQEYFVEVDFPEAVEKAVLSAAARTTKDRASRECHYPGGVTSLRAKE